TRRTCACSPTPLRGPKIGAILKHRFGPIAFPIYQCGAADAPLVGWRFINHSSWGKLRMTWACPSSKSRFRKTAMDSISQFEAALHTEQPSARLRQLALDLAAEAYSPPAVLELFDAFRAV